jgi:hypothetical protein
MTIKMVDVSGYQATTYPLTGIDAVCVKATEGTGFKNSEGPAQLKFARAHDMVVGHYHFMQGTSIHAQMDFFLKTAAPKVGEFLALDWENPSVSDAEKDDALSYLSGKAEGHRVVLYCNKDYWVNRERGSQRADGLWIANYNGHPGQPGIQDPWWGHQFTSSPIDTSVLQFKSRQEAATWAGRKRVSATSLPSVSLPRTIAAFKTDPKAAQGHQTYANGIRLVELALVHQGFMKESKYTKDGSAGSLTIQGYAGFQKWYSRQHNLGWTGADVNGIPGATSLKALGSLSKLFTVRTTP